MKIDHLKNEEKEIIVRYVMKCYRSSKQNAEYLEQCDLVNEKMDEYRSEKKTCLLVERALNEMDVQLRNFLLSELKEKKKVDLNNVNCSRSSYYRTRVLAVDDFLRCL
jgi:hypothetical protein